MKKSVWWRDVGGDGNEYKMVPEINALSLWNNVVVAKFPYLIQEQIWTFYSVDSNEA
jgi:hypothetical protein